MAAKGNKTEKHTSRKTKTRVVDTQVLDSGATADSAFVVARDDNFADIASSAKRVALGAVGDHSCNVASQSAHVKLVRL